MKAKIEIEMGNSAFDEFPNHELSRILRELANRAEVCELIGGHFLAVDSNGNRVGVLRLEDSTSIPVNRIMSKEK